MICSSTNWRMVLRISSWMSVRPSVSRRRPMLVLSFRGGAGCFGAARSPRAVEDYPAVCPRSHPSAMTNLTSAEHEPPGPREPRGQRLAEPRGGPGGLVLDAPAQVVALGADAAYVVQHPAHQLGPAI